MKSNTIEPEIILSSSFSKAWKSIKQAIGRYQLWGLMGFQDIRQRYQRSILGPLWITISMGILILTLGSICGDLFNSNLKTYLPYLSSGLIAWNLLSISLSESCTAFIEAAGYLKQINLPHFLLILRVVWRNAIVFLHTMILPIIVAFCYHININKNIFLLLPATILLLCTISWVGLLLSILSSRFRDVPPIINTVLQPIFYLTPIIWHADQIKRPVLKFIILLNPFYYFIEIMRKPFLGQSVPESYWFICIAITAFGWAISFLLYSRYRKFINYWL